MISNQILQTNIEGLKGIARVDLAVCDTEGKALASTFTGAEEYESAILAFVDSPTRSGLTRTILLRICCLTIFCWLTSITGLKSCILRRM